MHKSIADYATLTKHCDTIPLVLLFNKMGILEKNTTYSSIINYFPESKDSKGAHMLPFPTFLTRCFERVDQRSIGRGTYVLQSHVTIEIDAIMETVHYAIQKDRRIPRAIGFAQQSRLDSESVDEKDNALSVATIFNERIPLPRRSKISYYTDPRFGGHHNGDLLWVTFKPNEMGKGH